MARKSKEDWFNAGIELLVQHGDDGLNIEKMAAQAGVTKGSFYHHFGNLSSYKTALLEYLERAGFVDVIKPVDTSSPPAEQLRQLTDHISRLNLAEQKAIRQWAERDEQARALVNRLDEKRLTYLTQLATDMTGDLQRGEFMARLGYAFFLGSFHMNPPIEGKEYRDMTELLLTLLPPETT